MVVRAIVLSLALLVGIGTIVPLATEYAEAGSHKTKRYKKKERRWKGVKKYSKRWWQLYRAQERRKHTAAARRRSLRLRQLRLAKAHTGQTPTPEKAVAAKPKTPESKAMLPTGQPAPKGWTAGQATNSEVSFNVDGGKGSASISVIGPATGDTVSTGRNRSVGGVSTSALRREVINQMIRENGWVVNDYQKEIGGKQVYVVVAQSQGAGGRVNSRMFYFTEADGRIYSVATNSHVDAADRVAEESENVVFLLQNRPRPVQQASKE